MHRTLYYMLNLVEYTQSLENCRVSAKYRYGHLCTAQEIQRDNDGPSVAGAKPQHGSVHARVAFLVPRVPFSGALRS